MIIPIKRNATRKVDIGKLTIGNYNPIAVQSMASTHTWEVEKTLAQLALFERAGADIIRIAVDSDRDIAALARIREQTDIPLSADLQENYRLAPLIAPYVDKLRYNPWHLYHHEREKSWRDKVCFITESAQRHNCALRVGVNGGSVDPKLQEKYLNDLASSMLESAYAHCDLLDSLGFTNYCVSLKDSDPYKVILLNQRFSAQRPDIPLHLGVTEAGMLPGALIKTRIALEQLIGTGIGYTIRVSLTLPSSEKAHEILIGKKIIDDIYHGLVLGNVEYGRGLNIISCPSCSRVENEDYIALAARIKECSNYAAQHRITIAVMWCRVNGPGETDDADIGVWCGPRRVNLKRGRRLLGSYTYDEVAERFKETLDAIIRERS